MSAPSIEKRFAILCDIVRAQHFAWRESVCHSCPDVDPAEVVDRMWRITGKQSAVSYLKRIDMNQPLALQVARSIVFASESMGEAATVEPSLDRGHAGDDGENDQAFVRHTSCPWFGWHQRNDLVGEDRAGCDRWFQTIVDELNRELGSELRVETLETLPDGDQSCLRRLWVERNPP